MGLYSRIKSCRLRKGLTQSEVAARIPTSQSNYSKIEAGIISLEASTIKRLCEIFQVSSDYLLDVKLKNELYPDNDYRNILKAYTCLQKVIDEKE